MKACCIVTINQIVIRHSLLHEVETFLVYDIHDFFLHTVLVSIAVVDVQFVETFLHFGVKTISYDDGVSVTPK